MYSPTFSEREDTAATCAIASLLATGQGVRTLNGDLVAPSVKVGDQVLVEAHAGIEVKDGDEKYVIVGEANILAIVEE